MSELVVRRMELDDWAICRAARFASLADAPMVAATALERGHRSRGQRNHVGTAGRGPRRRCPGVLLADGLPRLRRAGPEPREQPHDGRDLVRRPVGHRPAALRGPTPRHPIHGSPPTDEDWDHWRRTARPLRVGSILRVDTNLPVDTQALIAWIQAHGTLTSSQRD
jgi:hypothetical protein